MLGLGGLIGYPGRARARLGTEGVEGVHVILNLPIK